MPISRTKLYTLLSIVCISGYAWLLIQLSQNGTNTGLPTVCFIKSVTGVPCPSCGSTRSVLELLHGQLKSAFLLNPLGFVLLAGLLIIPLWLLFDLLSQRQSLLQVYLRSEQFIRKPLPAIIFILLLLINWIWNIVKGL
ncbi:MAG: DUF2752 domain-containing protein [Mangrovibacterium sp.]